MTRASIALFILLSLAVIIVPGGVHAASASDIAAQIQSINAQKAQIDAQIAQYQAQLNQLGTQHQTLQSAIQTIDVTRSKTAAQISSIQKKIAAANLQLQQLAGQITTTESMIATDKASVAESLRDVDATDDASLIESLFSANTFADAWRAGDALTSVNDALRTHADALANVKTTLDAQNTAVTTTKVTLSSSNADLTTQKQALDAQKAAKNTLLTQTKSQESSYQSLIAQKKAQEASFEKELNDLQAQLSPVGAGSIPHPGSGILSWPFSDSVMHTCPGKASALGNPYCVTQFFGNTPFATANPSVYNGMGHDGIDIGVPLGTPVEAALSGTVLATGNTDVKAPNGAMCYSFGKWVMLQHANGLDTLYAHLSQINVSKGQSVGTGDVIALSGMTGYATGPHLHFGVYAAAGVQIMDLGKWRGSGGTPCTNAGAILPVAPNNGYLNPMSYL